LRSAAISAHKNVVIATLLKIVIDQDSYAILNINFYAFSGLFPDLTFPNDIPKSNAGTIIVNTMKTKLSISPKISK